MSPLKHPQLLLALMSALAMYSSLPGASARSLHQQIQSLQPKAQLSANPSPLRPLRQRLPFGPTKARLPLVERRSPAASQLAAEDQAFLEASLLEAMEMERHLMDLLREPGLSKREEMYYNLA